MLLGIRLIRKKEITTTGLSPSMVQVSAASFFLFFFFLFIVLTISSLPTTLI